jgi:hypothetical protein
LRDPSDSAVRPAGGRARALPSIAQGEPAVLRSSPAVVWSFCGRCGPPLTYRNETELQTVDVMTCSLDAPEPFAPTFHVWLSDKLGLEVVSDGLAVDEKTVS